LSCHTRILGEGALRNVSWFALLALPALACATSYQPEGFSGGYSEMQLAKQSWLVTFRGNAKTSPSRASDFALLRGCELVLESGCTHYRLLNAHADSSSGVAVIAMNPTGATAIPLRKPVAQVAIECSDAREGISAGDTVSRVRAKYQLDR